MFKNVKLFSFKILKRILRIPKKFLIPAVILILLLTNFLLTRNNNKIAPQFAQVKRENLRQLVSSSGILTGNKDLDLKFMSGGQLAYLNVGAGDSVFKGQVIAGLDTTQLNINLRTAQNTLRDKRATVDKIRDDENGVTNETFAQRQTRTTAEVAQDNAYEGVLAAQKALRDSVMIAPIDGIITNVNVVPGQIISVADVVAHLEDFSKIIFKSDVDESDISKITIDQPAEVTLNAYGDKIFKGKVSEIDLQTRTTSSGATVVTVKVELENANLDQVQGLNGQVNIITSEKDNVLSIPLDALRNGDTVFVRTKFGIRPQKVVTGLATDTNIEIKEGLKEGDEVVVNQTEAVKGTGGVFRLPFLRLGGGGVRGPGAERLAP